MILSGAAKHLGEQFSGDVTGFGLRWEVKARKDGFKTLHDWLKPDYIDALALKVDRKEWLVVIPLSKFMELIENKNNPEGSI